MLLQKFPAERFTTTTELTLSTTVDGARSGLTVMGRDYAFLAVEKTASGWQLVYVVNRNADKGETEVTEAIVPVTSGRVWLRASVDDGARTRFGYSTDGRTYVDVGAASFAAREGVWVGARIGLFTTPVQARTPGFTDVEWFRVEGR